MMKLRLYDSAFGPNWSPCGDSNNGEVEDYSVNIIDDVNGTDDDGLMQKLSVYQNPVEDKLVVEWQGEGQLNVEVIDIFGTSIYPGGLYDQAAEWVGEVVCKSELGFRMLTVCETDIQGDWN